MKGFTLIEVMIGVVFVLIVVSVLASVGAGLSGQSQVSFGLNGFTEMRCINGYQFVIGSGGQARQVLDEFGKGARCN